MKCTPRAAAWLALALWGPAQADFIEKKKYQEVMDPPTPVRGHAVVGISVLPTAEDLKSDTVWVRFDPSLQAQDLRIDVASSNGRLRGDGLWAHKPPVPAGPTQNWVALAAPPNSPRPEHVDHLALAAQPAELNNGSTPTFQLVAWNSVKESATAVRIRLYVNTRRAELFAYGPGDPKGVRCQPISGGPTVRFDAVCDMDLPLQGKERVSQLMLLRRDGGQTSKQPVNLRW